MPTELVRNTNIPSCAAVGLTAGNALIRGIRIPSELVGAVALDAEMSSCAFGDVFPIPTCEKADWKEIASRINNSFIINEIDKRRTTQFFAIDWVFIYC